MVIIEEWSKKEIASACSFTNLIERFYDNIQNKEKSSDNRLLDEFQKDHAWSGENTNQFVRKHWILNA